MRVLDAFRPFLLPRWVVTLPCHLRAQAIVAGKRVSQNKRGVRFIDRVATPEEPTESKADSSPKADSPEGERQRFGAREARRQRIRLGCEPSIRIQRILGKTDGKRMLAMNDNDEDRSGAQPFIASPMNAPTTPFGTVPGLASVTSHPAVSFSQFALENTTDGVFWSNEEGAIEFVNDAAAQLLGYSREELLGRPVLSLITCLNPSDWPSYWARLKSEGYLIYETDQIARNGMHIPVEVIANHMVWEGKHYGFGFVRNIAERKRAEETLLFNQRAIEQAADAVYWIASSGKIDYANAAACEMLGRTKTDLIGRNIHDEVDICISAADWPLHWEKLKQSGSIFFESCHRARDGRIIPVETRANSILREGKEYSCAFVRDISERKRTEESLRASEAQHRNLLLNLNAGVVVHAPDTTMLLHNRRALEVLGLSPGQMSGKVAMDPSWRFVHEDGQTMPLEDYPVMRVRSSREPLCDYVVGINRPLGGIAWTLVNAFPEFDEANQLQQIVVTFVDITARKAAETRLAEQLVEIRARHDELDRFNRAMVNRELRMLELKQEVNALLGRLGETPRYTSTHAV